MIHTSLSLKYEPSSCAVHPLHLQHLFGTTLGLPDPPTEPVLPFVGPKILNPETCFQDKNPDNSVETNRVFEVRPKSTSTPKTGEWRADRERRVAREQDRRANMTRIRQSRPDSGLGFQVKVRRIFSGVPYSIRCGVHKRPYVGASHARYWSPLLVLEAILWAFVAKK